MKTHLQKLGEFVAGLKYEDIPMPVLRAAKMQVLDMIAAVHGSEGLYEAGCAVNGILAGSLEGGRSTVLADGRKLSPAEAVIANSACSMALDFDDIIWMGHTCHSAVFASLAVAEHEMLGSKEFLTAVVAANEVSGRLGATCFLGPLNGQMWTFIHLIGAAAGTAKLLGLNARKTTSAMAIALSQPTFALQPGFLGATSKILAAGIPASTGITSAYLADGGVTGNPGILEDPRGFWRRFSFRPLPEMLDDTGSFWALETLSVKTFPGCHYFQTALSSLERILSREPGISFENVKAIKIKTTKLAVEVMRFSRENIRQDGPITPLRATFDLAVAAAIMLQTGKFGAWELREEPLDRDSSALRKWLEKITVEHDPMMTLEVIKCANAIPSGRKALGTFKLKELVGLARRYREEYGSNLFESGLLKKGIAGAFSLLKNIGGKKAGGANGSGTIIGDYPLLFPGSVTVKFIDGSEISERTDLPPGSLANPGAEIELKNKFMNTTGKVLGKERAEKLFADGMNLEDVQLEKFINYIVTPS